MPEENSEQEYDTLITKLWKHFVKNPSSLAQYGPDEETKFGFSKVDEWTIPIARGELPPEYSSWEDYLTATLSEVEEGYAGYLQRLNERESQKRKKKKKKQ